MRGGRGGGRGHHGPGPGFWFWGPRHHGPGESCCWLCFWCCAAPPPPHPEPILVVTSNPVSHDATVVTQYREIKALEFRDGDVPIKYYLTVPQDIVYGQVLQVELGGRAMSVKIPDYVRPGEKVIIVAPAPVAVVGTPAY